MRWLPQSKMGKVGFWLGVASFALLYLQYWYALLFNTSVWFPGALVIVGLCTAGILSVIALVKHRDLCYLLFVSVFLGILGLVFVLGELLFPH